MSHASFPKTHPTPIVMKFKPEDRARIERIAEKEQRALGALCRLFVLKSLDACEQSTADTHPTAA